MSEFSFWGTGCDIAKGDHYFVQLRTFGHRPDRAHSPQERCLTTAHTTHIMASRVRQPSIVSTGFIWKPDKDTKHVQVLLCKATDIYADNFVDDHDCGTKCTTYTLEQRNQELGGFSGCVPLRADVYHFLFRVDYVDGQQQFRASELYPRTVLASGREVNYIEAPNVTFFESSTLDKSREYDGHRDALSIPNLTENWSPSVYTGIDTAIHGTKCKYECRKTICETRSVLPVSRAIIYVENREFMDSWSWILIWVKQIKTKVV